MGELAERRSQTEKRVKEIRKKLRNAENFVKDKACVYATGSFGRGEASPYSDLDLFILGKMGDKRESDGKERSLLKPLDEICVKAELIQVTRELNIPEFSGDGRYLVHYSVHDLTKTLGTPKDDVTNTFTARLLLLLESRPLLERSVYQDVTEEVIAEYWGDYEDHKNDFIPAFLANDILRLWRTFCVNYEARTSKEPEEEKSKRKLKNYKLKHSRLLTCYSALLYLLAIYGHQNTVNPPDARNMLKLSPTERLEWLHEQPYLADARDTVTKLLEQYERFLETTNAGETELIGRFQNKETSQNYMNAAYEFGDLIFKALNVIGNGNRFHRLLVV